MATDDTRMADADNMFELGQVVRWDKGNGENRGTISGKFERKVARRMANGLVTRYGSAENPAYLITLDNGTEALMLGSELVGS